MARPTRERLTPLYVHENATGATLYELRVDGQPYDYTGQIPSIRMRDKTERVVSIVDVDAHTPAAGLVSLTPKVGGRGWQLTDAPYRGQFLLEGAGSVKRPWPNGNAMLLFYVLRP